MLFFQVQQLVLVVIFAAYWYKYAIVMLYTLMNVFPQKARVAECERMLVVIDMAMGLSDGQTAVQAVVTCYRLLAPLMFHQLVCDPVVQVCKKIK